VVDDKDINRALVWFQSKAELPLSRAAKIVPPALVLAEVGSVSDGAIIAARLEARLSNPNVIEKSYSSVSPVASKTGRPSWLFKNPTSLAMGISAAALERGLAARDRSRLRVERRFRVQAHVGGMDFNGAGTQGDLLPGTTVDAFNRGMGRTDLERLVDQFNSIYPGTKDAAGHSIPRLVLPANYSFGDDLHSLRSASEPLARTSGALARHANRRGLPLVQQSEPHRL
jgi:hypothetical protein